MEDRGPEDEAEMTGEEEADTVNMKTKAGLSDILGEVYHAFRESEWKNERAKNNNAYVPTMKEHVANIITHGVITQIQGVPKKDALFGYVPQQNTIF